MAKTAKKLARFEYGVRCMGVDERAAMRKAVEAAAQIAGRKSRTRMMDALEGIGTARGRATQRRESDKRTDSQRRKLVGARLPEGEAARCRRCADLTGLSLYGFVVQALDAACSAAERVM